MTRAFLYPAVFAFMSWRAWHEWHSWTSGVAFGAGLIIGVVELKAALDPHRGKP